ncbi:hypothetical protein F0U61_53400 [Archangium violaceum]|uniref:hypothetical protein n=1 Tax=Archangium violaceum TaxID=83451 RepID=UPI002B28FEAE|nr:hypothetical protein F0U61_53400 [Archangium violaceum]
MSAPGSRSSRVLRAGDALAEPGSFLRGTLGGWFRQRASGRPVLLTVAHLLTPPALRAFPAPPPPPPPGPVLSLESEPVWLCTPPSSEPVARVLACGVHAAPGSADACIAAPLDEAMCTDAIPSLPWVPVPGEPRVGHPVLKVGWASGVRHGRIVAVDWPSHRYGSRADVLIESLDGQPFGVEGDSGALIFDTRERTVVGLHLGDVLEVVHRELRRPRLWVAHPLERLLRLFDLTAF